MIMYLLLTIHRVNIFPKDSMWISFINGDYYSEYFSTKKETMKYIAKILEKKEISKEELENWKKEHKDSEEYISIHECAIVE